MTDQQHGDQHDSGASGGPANLSDQFTASTDEVAALYDDWAENYDTDLDQWGYDVPERIAARLAEAGLATGEILDAGCGTGRSGAALRAHGATDVIGTDVSPASLEVAERRGVYRSTQVVDLKRTLPFATDRFVASISAGVFSYLGNPEPTLRELLRVVRPVGLVIFSQRTDLWAQFGCDAVIARLVGERLCTAEVSDAQPYLPGHPEFTDTIGVVYTTLQVTG